LQSQHPTRRRRLREIGEPAWPRFRLRIARRHPC
jgi:hypothetical protein